MNIKSGLNISGEGDFVINLLGFSYGVWEKKLYWNFL